MTKSLKPKCYELSKWALQMSSPNGRKNTKAWSYECVRSLAGIFQEFIRSLSDAWTNSVLELCYAPLISPLQFQPKYYELSKWALQISSPNKFSKLEKKPQKLKKSVRNLSGVSQESVRSLSGVCQISVSCNGQPRC